MFSLKNAYNICTYIYVYIHPYSFMRKSKLMFIVAAKLFLNIGMVEFESQLLCFLDLNLGQVT